MATQYIKFKRSAIPGKRPSNSQMELGELALNTNDGRLFTKKENVGIGTTVTLLNVWTENVGGGAYYTDGSVGIGTTNPTSVLEVYTNDGDIKLGDITALSTTDVGISFSGLGTYTSAIFTELDGQILSYGINTPQIQNPRNTGRVGGIFRLDTRLPGGLGDSSCFVIKYAPVGFATTAGGPANGIRNGLIVSLQDGKTYLVPDEGNVLVGLKTDTGTLNQKLQVLGGAYINDSVGIGTTNPIQQVQVGGIGTNTGLVISGFGSIGITTNNPVTYIDISSNTPTRNTVQFGSFGIQSFDNVNGFLSNNGYWDGEKWIYRRNGHSSLLQFLQGNILLRTLPVGTAGSSGNIDTRIAVQNNGNIGINTNNPLLQLQIGPFNSSSIVGVTSVGLVGIGTTNPTSRLHIIGDALVTGVVTATAFNGNINAGIGTITNLSGTNVSYSGVGTIGTLDVNSADIDNLNTINISNSGIITTSNLVVNDEFDVYATDSTFHDNVVIQGNLTVNGTQVILNVDDKFIKDKQIVLGFSTTNDVDDTTANGGGFGIASTEGSPLVCLQCTGINTLPSTYKQLIWTKANTFGAGTTDAFLFNYAVGIGSTLVPNGVRLSVGGVKITDSDVNATTFTGSGANLTSLNASQLTTGTVPDARLSGTYTGISINTTGIITATSFTGSGANLTTLNASNISSGTLNNARLPSNISISGISTASRFVSTVSTGTAPLTVSSSTLVTNLNADLLDGQQGSYYLDTSSTAQTKTGNLTVNGILTLGASGPTNALNLNNNNIIGVNNIVINDPGPDEGISWFGGNGWKIYESPNNLTTNSGGNLQFVRNTSRLFTLDTSGNAEFTGNLGIGTTNPTSKLTVQGDVLVSGVITSTDYNCSSDINLKENIQPIENPIDKVLNITGVSFDWKEDGRSSMGVIAQEVERVLPELVSGSDTKTVNYNGLIGLLIEVVKEQQREINTLKEKIK
jgi:hypothetical protein